ncbi:isomerase [Streptomyces sp. NPDC001984]
MTETTAPDETSGHAEPRTDASGTEAVLDRYVRFWNASTEAEQRSLAAETFADRVEYHAEIGVLTGAQALMDFRDQFLDHMGTASLQLRARPRFHHDRARLQWEIVTGEPDGHGEGRSFATGTDVLVLDGNGRITSVTTFLDRAPEGFDSAAHH